MKAIIFKEHGGPENLSLATVPDPVPEKDEVVVQVKACALNHVDYWVLKGGPAYPVQRPHVLGADVAGVVEGLGKGVNDLKCGQRVIIAPGISCFQCTMCKAGYDNLCETYSILGAKFWGGYAEKVKVPAANIIPIPDSLSFEEAAAFPLTFLTAWHMLVTRAGLKRWQYVIVIGASSGVGTAAIQIAKMHGAFVLATSTSDEKLQRARELGADAVVNSTKDSIAHVARAWTQKRGVDIVFEHVGPATWDQSVGSLAPNGKLVTCGSTTRPEVKKDLRYVFSRELSILGNRMGTRAELNELVGLVASRKLKPLISKTFPLADAAAALTMMEQRQHFGKIVLIP
jgi:2-desacetyl-2-hydroxyethyl bacteriochlorophyllide A dehydrogenase